MGARGGHPLVTSLLGTPGRMPYHADMPECPLLTSSFASPAEMRGGSYAHPIRCAQTHEPTRRESLTEPLIL